jgi:LPLT family lysophospholipid transporter-like MFS transporter
MTRGVWALLFAQFLTAFADNAILFTAIAMVLTAPASAPWYVPALQSAFLVAFVILAPWVGPLADRRPKAHVLLLGNFLKAFGAVLMLFGVEPIAAYTLVGVGAAVYSPAKYGILPELVGHDQMVKANAWIEGSTIAAIVIGTYVGARIADQSIVAALGAVTAAYAASLAVTVLVPKTTPQHSAEALGLRYFGRMIRELLASDRARFTMLGAGLFWSAGAVMRLLLVAFAPLVLATQTTSEIAELTLYLAAGIVAGSVAVPMLIPIERLRRARFAAYLMGVCIVLFAQVESMLAARLMLAAIGVCGGLFVVPVNAALQDIGHRTIGSGGAVAVQNFFQNIAMLGSVALYTLAASRGASPVTTVAVVGVLVLIATFLVSWHLPPDPQRGGVDANRRAAGPR